MKAETPIPQNLLPLTPAVFHILLALAGQGFRRRSPPCGRWRFIHSGVFNPKVTLMDAGRYDPVRYGKGSLWDTLVLLQEAKPQVFFIPKDWSQLYIELKVPSSTRLAGSAGHPH